ncbi:MAG TPA: carbohydrate-binding family 9-like protein [Candidatus Acidoferrum sp.]|nr:carbohydrate-binding family 9-like protein [Candidatus Acidoferrum sp.]
MADIRTDAAFAVRLADAVDAEGFPPERAWTLAPPVCFNADWQGKNADRGRETRVRLLWNAEFLFLRFDARYRSIHVFADGEASGRRDGLWNRDVCEVFLQPRGSHANYYKEIEIAPNGLWVDLEIGPDEKRSLRSGLRRRVNINEPTKEWHAALAVPMKSLIARFEMPAVWRVNFFRVEGEAEPRFYSAWRATNTATPNFHVPEAFGALVFTDAASKIGG